MRRIIALLCLFLAVVGSVTAGCSIWWAVRSFEGNVFYASVGSLTTTAVHLYLVHSIWVHHVSGKLGNPKVLVDKQSNERNRDG